MHTRCLPSALVECAVGMYMHTEQARCVLARWLAWFDYVPHLCTSHIYMHRCGWLAWFDDACIHHLCTSLMYMHIGASG